MAAPAKGRARSHLRAFCTFWSASRVRFAALRTPLTPTKTRNSKMHKTLTSSTKPRQISAVSRSHQQPGLPRCAEAARAQAANRPTTHVGRLSWPAIDVAPEPAPCCAPLDRRRCSRWAELKLQSLVMRSPVNSISIASGRVLRQPHREPQSPFFDTRVRPERCSPYAHLPWPFDHRTMTKGEALNQEVLRVNFQPLSRLQYIGVLLDARVYTWSPRKLLEALYAFLRKDLRKLTFVSARQFAIQTMHKVGSLLRGTPGFE